MKKIDFTQDFEELIGNFLYSEMKLSEFCDMLNNHVQQKLYTEQTENDKTISINDLNLSVRTINCLKSVNINTLYDITTLNRKELFKVRNMGYKCVNQILKILEIEKLEFLDINTLRDYCLNK